MSLNVCDLFDQSWWSNRSKTFRLIILTAFYLKDLYWNDVSFVINVSIMVTKLTI